MFRQAPGRRGRMVTAIATTTAVVSALALPLLATTASADTAGIPVAATATTPTTGLVNGSVVHFHVDATAPNAIYGVDARLCTPTADIQNTGDFNPSGGGNCIMAPMSGGGQALAQVATAPPNATADLNFTVGSGTGPLDGSNLAGDTSLTCDATHPCTIWLKLTANATASAADGLYFQHFDVTFAGAPAAPTAVAATPGNTTANLSWTAPAGTGGAPIDYYTITRTSPAAAPFNTPTSATSFSVTGLSNFTPYSYTVAAHNTSGFTSPDSAPVSVTPAPGAPTNVLANAGNANAVVTWTAPSGPAPDSYVITGTPGGTATVAGTVTTATVTGLTNGTGYTFTVQAVYGGTPGPVSAPSGTVTPSGQVVTQTFTVSRPAGALLIGEACSGATGGPDASHPYLGVPNQNCNIDLGTAAINAAGTYYTATGAILPVTVLDSRDTDIGWNVTTSLTDFTGTGGTFPACNFGFAPVGTGNGAPTGYTQTTASGAAVAAGCPAGGYAGTHVSMSATGTNSATGGLGYSTLTGPVDVQIPVTAHAGSYSAILSFTLLSA